jgi:calcineurin-like phosphoesterase family protein
MGKIIKVVDISEDLSNYIQMLHYEMNGYKNLVMSICRMSEFKKDEEMYGKLMKEYQASYASLELALNELVIKHCPDEDTSHIRPIVDFLNNKVRFEEAPNECKIC